MSPPSSWADATVVLQGGCAQPVLAGGCGRVLAVLSASVYLQSGAGVCCVGPRGLGPGPINVLFEGGPAGFPEGLSPGEAWAVHEGVLRIGETLRLRTAPQGASSWWPVPPHHTPASLRRGLAALAAWLEARRFPDSPLGAVSPGPGAAPRSGLGSAGDRAIAELDAWLRADPRAGAPVPGGVADLIGRGPGLTPSGDDVLAGAMVALRGLGASAAADRLAAAVLPGAATRTGPIGAAYLGAAARGAWLAPLHEVLAALAGGAGGELHGALHALEPIGHRSGLDALAGVWLAARAVCSWQVVDGPVPAARERAEEVPRRADMASKAAFTDE